MAKFSLQLPKIGEEELSDSQAIKKIQSYLYQLNEQLRYMMMNLDEENLSEGAVSESALTPDLKALLRDIQIKEDDLDANISVTAKWLDAKFSNEIGDYSQLSLTATSLTQAVMDGTYTHVSGITIDLVGVEITGNKRVWIGADNSNSTILLNNNGVTIGANGRIALNAGTKLYLGTSENSNSVMLDDNGVSIGTGGRIALSAGTKLYLGTSENSNSVMLDDNGVAVSTNGSIKMLGNSSLYFGESSSGSDLILDRGGVEIGTNGSIQMLAGSSLYFGASSVGSNLRLDNDGVYIGTNGKLIITAGNFRLDANGNLTIAGDLTKTTKIGIFTIDADGGLEIVDGSKGIVMGLYGITVYGPNNTYSFSSQVNTGKTEIYGLVANALSLSIYDQNGQNPVNVTSKIRDGATITGVSTSNNTLTITLSNAINGSNTISIPL